LADFSRLFPRGQRISLPAIEAGNQSQSSSTRCDDSKPSFTSGCLPRSPQATGPYTTDPHSTADTGLCRASKSHDRDQIAVRISR